MNNKIIITTVGVALVVVAGMFFLQKNESVPTEDAVTYSDSALADFASCIADSGAKFYGASWCSHCRNQKLAFKDAADLLPYVECSTPDNKSQTEVCKEADIASYPTWIFADGTSLSGDLSFEILGESTGCVVPQE